MGSPSRSVRSEQFPRPALRKNRKVGVHRRVRSQQVELLRVDGLDLLDGALGLSGELRDGVVDAGTLDLKVPLHNAALVGVARIAPPGLLLTLNLRTGRRG